MPNVTGRAKYLHPLFSGLGVQVSLNKVKCLGRLHGPSMDSKDVTLLFRHDTIVDCLPVTNQYKPVTDNKRNANLYAWQAAKPAYTKSILIALIFMDISIVGVVLAAVSAMIVGSIWYSPGTFLPSWMKMVGANDEHMKKTFPKAMGLLIVAALLTAYVLAHFMVYTAAATGITGVMGGLETAFWIWLGIALTTVVAGSALDPRDSKLMYLYAGNRLVTLLVMGLILGLFMK